MLRKISMVVVAGAILMSGTSMVMAQASDPVAERKAIMKSNGAAMKKFTAVAKGEGALDDEVKRLATQMHEHALNLAALFPEGSGAGDTKARAAIWSDNAAFADMLEQYRAETAELLQVVQAGDVQAFAAQLGDVGGTCGTCHKAFRN